jgi:peptide-methionine (S)-S-oxide reductase
MRAAILILALALPSVARADEAIFAGGCFWCMETAFEGVPGVSAVISGYAGGQKASPTYDEVSAGSTGHAESVKVVYDGKKISYPKLLEIFWHNIDPFSANGQFCDRGSQYRSAIFFADETQRKAAVDSKRAAEATLGKPVVTEIVKAGPFYPAEEYHQDFFKKKPDHYQRYRLGCGRDRRLREVWGESARH